MTNDVAVFLDLDNLVIGAKQANLTFNINLILDHIKKITNGRIVLRRSYGDWRQSRDQLKDLTSAGFTTQSTVPINNFSKNLADMQIVVDAMDTLVDGHQYSTYVLMTGDRDFTPLVQSLRKRGKQVLGVGIKHTASSSFVGLCDKYIFYEDLIPTPTLGEQDVESLLEQAIDELQQEQQIIRASLLKQRMDELSRGAFSNSSHAEGSFRKFLANYTHIVEVTQEDTTTYVRKVTAQQKPSERPLHLRYRSGLKKNKLRIVPAKQRYIIIKDIITFLRRDEVQQWRPLIDNLAQYYLQSNQEEISKNLINAVMLLARRAEVVQTHKGKSLSTATVTLGVNGDKVYQEAILRCDRAYLQELMALAEPFDLEEAAIALYDTPKYTPYLKAIVSKLDTSA
ncbi:MAG: NYN domain-containing protein [Anaerolineales bacterium]|nr:NYN domain-containing protein [Anaerolineales bacterium]